MWTSRCYIVTDASLASLVQRNAKTLSFYSLIVEVTRRLIAFDSKAARISMYNMNGEHGPGGLMAAVHAMMNEHLAPGLALDAVTTIQMEQMSTMLNEAIPAGEQSIEVDLYAWQRHIFSISNSHAIFGPENIFAAHPNLEQEFWDFEDGMLGLVIDIWPYFTARKAYNARKRVLDGLVEYVKKGRYKKSSALIQKRVQTNLAYGLSEAMAGHAELILIFGILGNAVPSIFWLVANVFSRPELLRRIRDKVQHALELEPPDPNDTTPQRKQVSTRAVVKGCPLLYSCYRETLREISLLTSARLVLEDTLLADKYLLRKNSVVQIAGGVLHQDPKIWGSDCHAFDPERFLVSSQSDSNKEANHPYHKKTASPLPAGVPSAAFRAFGGGTVICPGRHFAQSELMVFAAILALGFDMKDVDGGILRLPEKDDMRIPLSVMKPVRDPRVRIRRRRGWENVLWEIGL